MPKEQLEIPPSPGLATRGSAHRAGERAERPAVLVTGATGFIGRALVERLVKRGQRVIAISRDAVPIESADIEVRVADLSTGVGVGPDLFLGVERVFHCAGEIRDVAAMRALHVDGTSRLLRALASAPLERPIRWVQLSSVGAYGRPPSARTARSVDEDATERPVGEYETTKTESDCLVREAAARGLLTFSILRPSAVIGARMSNSSLHGLLGMVRRGWFFHVGPDGGVANYVHVDDVIEGLIACGWHPHAPGCHFNMSSDCGWTELINEIALCANVSPPQLRVPVGLARILARVGEAVGAPLTVARVDTLIGRTRYPSDRIQQTLGFQFSKPMPAAARDLVVRKQ